MSAPERIGFIGLGDMGLPMVQRLLAAGHDVAVWARRPAAAAAALAAGATWEATPAKLAARSSVVCSIVTHGRDVEEILFAADGLAQGFAAGDLFIDLSTIAPSLAKDLAARLAAIGVAMLDAPVSGGSAGAAAGSLAIMAGGSKAAFQRAEPLFAALGKTIVHLGGSGAGQVAKACNQMVMVAAIAALAEATHLGNAAGIAAPQLHAALAAGSAGSRVLEVFGPRMAERDFAPGVKARLHHKDYALLLNEAHAMHQPLPLAASVAQMLNALMAQGLGDSDTSALLRVLEAATPGS